MKAAATLMLAGLVLAGCESWNVSTYDAPQPLEKYPVGESASAECIESARRATKWCVASTAAVNSDTTWQRECMVAQWQYQSSCAGGGGGATPANKF
jgi:hypothetical protein